MIRTISLGVIALLVIACHRKSVPGEEATEAAVQNTEAKIEQLAIETFQTGYKTIFNQSGTAALVRKSVKPHARSIYHTVYFFIYDVQAAEKIHEDVVMNAENVKWISEEEVCVTSVPGQIEDLDTSDTQQGYIYNVRERTKRSLGMAHK